jgi:hypothetical protein
MNKTLLILPAVALTAALVGCNRADEGQTTGSNNNMATPERRADSTPAPQARTEGPSPGAQAGADAGAKVSDATITAEVKSALAADPQLASLKIDVDTDNGVVTLSGPAPSEEAKSRATQIAAGPKGVMRVENRLEVKAS